jgi:WD40 repeat protein
MPDHELSLDDIFSRLKKEGNGPKKEIRVPFKFLDSYTREDEGIFFGRDNETEEIFRKLYSGKLLLVYGKSGTGKSSIINCGLISKIPKEDIFTINIRCGKNAYNNFISEIKKYSEIRHDNPFEILEDIFYSYSKPVALIFDQFEEVFILSDEKERKQLADGLNQILRSRLKINIILVIREEYFASLTEFESVIPGLYSNRVRIERMNRYSAKEAIIKPCLACNVGIEEGLPEKIIEQLAGQSEGLELTWLQILMDRLYKTAVESDPVNPVIRTIDLTSLERMGNVLSNFLDEQLRLMPEGDLGEAVLKTMISADGTKKLVNLDDISDALKVTGYSVDHNVLEGILMHLVNVRIISDKNDEGFYELRHDAIAGRIYERMTAIEKDIVEVRQFLDNAFSVYEKRGKLLTTDDLKYIAPYEDKLYLAKSSELFIHRSKIELTRSKKRRRNLLSVSVLALIFVLSGFTIWALREKEKSNQNYLKARAVSFNFLSQKVIESDPTIALRLVEYAAGIDSVNQDIIDNLNRIYYDNNFYRIVSRHESSIMSVAFSPDGKSFLTGSQDSTARLWNLEGNELRVFRHKDWISSVAFSPDGKSILTGSMDKTARLWDLNGNLLQEFTGHKGIIFSVAFSPDGKTILTGSLDKTARLWNLRGQELQVFKGHQDNIISVAFSPDGKSILTGSNDKTARLWDLHGKTLQMFKGHEGVVTSVAFSPDGEDIFTGSTDGTARLWDLRGNVLMVFKGHEQMITSLAISSDGKHLITGSWDKTVRLWDMYGKVLQIFKGHEADIEGVAFSPDNKSILTGSGDKTARLWDLDGLVIKELIGHDEAINSVAFSHNGKNLLTGSIDKTARLWDLQGNLIQVFKGHEDGIWAVAFSPDDKSILTGSTDKTARLWDLHGNTLKVFKGHEEMIWAVSFSPDGKTILTGSMDKTARLWDINGKMLQVFEGHEGSVNSVAFSPDGKSILTGSWDKTARLWSLNGTLLHKFPDLDGYVNSVGFSPDGKYIVAGSQDKIVRLWDLQGNIIQVFKGINEFVSSVAFAPDGKRLLTVSSAINFSMPGTEDNTACLWDLQGNQLQFFKGHAGRINSVAFSPDGKNILTGSWDKTARLWEVKKSHNKFMMENSYQDLSVFQKTKYGILK